MKRFLLLSDIHFLYTAREQDEHSRVRECFLKDLSDFTEVEGKIDYILVSGDIASKGQENEYDIALEFFKHVCTVTKCNMEDIYVIPGNHDKNFSASHSDLRELINWGLSQNCVDTSEMFYNMIRNDSNAARMMYEPFKSYNMFAVKMDSFDELMEKCIDDKDFSYDVRKHQAYYRKQLGQLGNYPIFLYGMNSCLNCDWTDEDDFGKGHKMFLPRLIYNVPVDADGCINISMLHHPLEKVSNGDEIAKFFDKSFHIQIFGHLHKTSSSVDTCVKIQSGALQPPANGNDKSDAYFSVYNILELDVLSDTQSRDILQVNLRVEKYNRESCSFNHHSTENRTYRIPLTRHSNRWNKNRATEDSDKHSAELPSGITLRQVRLRFLQCSSRDSLIKKMGNYDNTKSLNENCIDFLNEMEKSSRLCELWNSLN